MPRQATFADLDYARKKRHEIDGVRLDRSEIEETIDIGRGKSSDSEN